MPKRKHHEVIESGEYIRHVEYEVEEKPTIKQTYLKRAKSSPAVSPDAELQRTEPHFPTADKSVEYSGDCECEPPKSADGNVYVCPKHTAAMADKFTDREEAVIAMKMVSRGVKNATQITNPPGRNSMAASVQKPKRFNYKALAMDEIKPVNNEPWKITLQKILNNHNKLVRNFNQLLAHQMTTEPKFGPVIMTTYDNPVNWVESRFLEGATEKQKEFLDYDGKVELYSGSRGGFKTARMVEKVLEQPDQLLTKQLLRQFNWYCRCVCPIPVKKDAIEICKECNKPVWDTGND